MEQFPVEYTPPGKYSSLSDDDLITVLASLTHSLVELRADLARVLAQYNSGFYRVFMEANGESVAGRNRLAEQATLSLMSERIECEANISATEDLCSLVRFILERRT